MWIHISTAEIWVALLQCFIHLPILYNFTRTFFIFSSFFLFILLIFCTSSFLPTLILFSLLIFFFLHFIISFFLSAVYTECFDEFLLFRKGAGKSSKKFIWLHFQEDHNLYIYRHNLYIYRHNNFKSNILILARIILLGLKNAIRFYRCSVKRLLALRKGYPI